MMDHTQDRIAERLRAATLDALHRRYGPQPEPAIRERAERELDGIEKAGLVEVFLALRDIMGELHAHEHISMSTSSIGSSFVANLLGITSINPLPPHYRCPSCLHTEFLFDQEHKCGADLPGRRCPHCGAEMTGDGFDVPFTTFLYGRSPRRPYKDTYTIGLLLSRDCAGHAVDLARSFWRERCIDRHPGVPGMLHIQPGQPSEPNIDLDLVHSQYITVLERLGKTTGVGPISLGFQDTDTMSLFSSPAALGLPEDDPVIGRTGAIGIPPFDDQAKRRMLELVRPATFDDLIRVHGLSVAHEPWRTHAIKLLQEKQSSIAQTLCFRDDISLMLAKHGMDADAIIDFSESKYGAEQSGKIEAQEALLQQYGLSDRFIESYKDVMYLFPKAHVAETNRSGFRLAWYKVHSPLAFYQETFQYLLENRLFDAELMDFGTEALRDLILHTPQGFRKPAYGHTELDTLELIYEFRLRGYDLGQIDLMTSKSGR